MHRAVTKSIHISTPVDSGIRRKTGPPRIITKKESSGKADYSKKWNSVLLKEAKSSSDEFKQRMTSTNDAHLKRYVCTYACTICNGS